MKKSDYLKLREKHWTAVLDWKTNPEAETRAHLDAEAAEAAGVVWEPEEPELPTRLRAFMGTITALVDYPAIPSAERGLSEAEAHEIVRRYHAWPELERLAEEMREIVWTLSPGAARHDLNQRVATLTLLLQGSLESGK